MTWTQTLELKHRLETALRAMVYQVDSKEEAAAAFGKPLEYYYNLPYEQWSLVSKRLVKKRERVMKECRALGIPGNMSYSDFPHYRRRMGLERKSK